MKILKNFVVLLVALVLAFAACIGAVWVVDRLGLNSLVPITAVILAPTLYGILKQG